MAGTLHHPSRAPAGAVASLVSGAVAQVLLRRRSIRGQLATGVALIVLGLAAVTAAVWAESLPAFLLGGALAGAGAGALLRGAISTVAGLAPAPVRGEALAGVFLGAYLGLAVPVLGLGILTQLVSAPVALLGFAAAIAALAALVSRPLLRP
ncbi:hypothetical protein ACQP2P_19095 [Dactylosporangium sp. CA-139114]|uniref:hypothetical protein n=1 Tax=Dactylosporangium sp. CA-139114 TaxID=3239931 RepID=UPI003D964781